MRSSVACAKCRSSKVRCVNQGLNTTCEACAKNQRTCTYAAPTAGNSSSAAKRRDSSLPNHDGSVTSTKKRKIAPGNLIKVTSPPTSDLLNPQLFTRRTWEKLFKIFQQHFAADLPFLHAGLFIKQLQNVDVRALVDPFASLLLAFLTLTTPFHDTFTQYPWRGAGTKSVPLYISMEYAELARSRLRTSNAYSKPSIETTQALFMLGLHEWRARQGAQCFLTIGTAISCAEFLRCNEHVETYGEDEDAWPTARPMKREEPELSPEDRFTRAEIKRRTYWCGFILDSYVSTGSGERRRQRIRMDEINIQLPCSEKSFELGNNVRTAMLGRGDVQQRFNDYYFQSGRRAYQDEHPSLKDEHAQEGLTWFIRALTVYRGVFSWVCNVTRSKEPKCPWDPESSFYKLVEEVETLQRQLNSDLRLTEKNTDYYLRNSEASRSYYVQLHSVLALCNMALHREYIAYLAWEQLKPAGPVDGPPLPPPPPHLATYWEDNARKCFQAARQFLDLAWQCHEDRRLVETPLVGFAMFYVTQIIIWCGYFPHQDEKDSLCKENRPDKGREDKFLQENLDKAATILVAMQERLPMACMWVRDADGYMHELEALRKEHRGSDSSPESNNDSSSSGSNSGRLPWVKVQRMLTDFGHTEDESMDGDTQVVTGIRFLDRASEPSSPPSVKAEPTPPKIEGEQATTGTPGFTALNHTRAPNGKVADGKQPKPTGGHAHVINHEYQPSFPSDQYNMAFEAPPSGPLSYQAPHIYQPADSQARAPLGTSVYSQQQQHINTAPVQQPSLNTYHAEPAYAHEYQGWGSSQFPSAFGFANDLTFDLPYPLYHGYSYPVTGNGAQHQGQS